jgi:hypothetical protein
MASSIGSALARLEHSATKDALQVSASRSSCPFDDDTAIVSSGLIDSMSLVDLISNPRSA